MRISSSARVGTVVLMIALILAGCARSPEAKKARYLERGNRYFKQEQYREAILEYRTVLRIDPKEPAATRQLDAAMASAPASTESRRVPAHVTSLARASTRQVGCTA